METIKEYKKDGITVEWEASICIHAGKCVKTLPQVFKPKERPWIQVENASVSAIEAAVLKCPSGAIRIKS